jgi:hypothetical protein
MVHSNTVNLLDYAQSCFARGDLGGAGLALEYAGGNDALVCIAAIVSPGRELALG